MKKLYLIILVVSIPLLYSQNKISELSWLEGIWTLDKWGGEMEEWWSSPRGNAIIGAYIFIYDDKINFTEHFIITEENDSITMKLKHFDSNFHSWEEKDEYVEFDFFDMGNNFIKFDGIEYKLVNDSTLAVIVITKNDGEESTEEFIYSRKKQY